MMLFKNTYHEYRMKMVFFLCCRVNVIETITDQFDKATLDNFLTVQLFLSTLSRQADCEHACSQS